MSWNNGLKQWYPIAIEALNHASVSALNIPTKKYPELFKQESVGLNMNVVAALANNLENRTPKEMGMKAEEWAQVLELNEAIGGYWNALAEPVHKQLRKEFEIMMNKPKLVVAGEA